ncbi:hypothetical protein EVG20_g6606 [Dentipellis fragilis]|uniref:Uncharacterized protein n=1 Tax=Dentipellis fragilis TaxID=205917 RepID=A0A4Y9YLY9_9AGAM|nr:hypothetical protein EVG20_g6606 [Dentipellis fragilis]
MMSTLIPQHTRQPHAALQPPPSPLSTATVTTARMRKAFSKVSKKVKMSLKRSKMSSATNATGVPSGSPAGVASSQRTINDTNAPSNMPSRAASPQQTTNVIAASPGTLTDGASSQQIMNVMPYITSVPSGPPASAASSQQAKNDKHDHGVLMDVARMLIKMIKETSDPFPPLKAAAAGISTIIESVDMMKGNIQETARLTALTVQSLWFYLTASASAHSLISLCSYSPSAIAKAS